MNRIPYHLVTGAEDEQTLTLFLSQGPVVIHGDHPSFTSIMDALGETEHDIERITGLVDATNVVDSMLTPLSERVSVGNGRVYFDGDELDSTLTDHILRILEEGLEDWRPLVRFLEKLATNPNPHSRGQLYGWLNTCGFTIASDGDIVAYKGVRHGDSGYESITAGPGIVDGREMTGHLPNNPGQVVEIARSKVTFDPSLGCGPGLHTGTWDYASMFAHGVVLEVRVNPRDVVSVPTDSNAQKMRVSRYRVVQAIEQQYDSAILYDQDDDDYWDDSDGPLGG